MSRIDDIFNKSINSSPEADDEIQAFDPIVEHGDSRLPHTFQFSVELFYGLVGLYTDPTTLEPVEKKLKQAVKNTPLETSELYLLSDNYDSHREQFPKLYSYHYGYVVYFNMTTDDFPPFIRFINSLIFCFPKKTTIWAGITSEAVINKPAVHYIREYSAMMGFDIFKARQVLPEYYKNQNNSGVWSEDSDFRKVLSSFLGLFVYNNYE